MNAVAFIILGTLLVQTLLEIIADALNLRRLKTDIPEAFAGLYPEDRYRKSQRYLKTTTRFGWITSAFSLAIVLAFWFGRGFPALDHWVRGLGWGPVATGLMYIGSLTLAYALLSQPFNIYATFVIESRFGFNRTTWKTYLKDLAKGTALAIVLGTPLLAGVLAFFEYTGPLAWLYCWIAVTLYLLVVQFVAPTWIMPLFNTYEPLKDEELKRAILAYARDIDFPLKNVYRMDGSKRTSKSNAFFTGFGRNKRIVLYDTLIDQHTTEELVSILAHEMGHYKKGHVLKSLCIGIGHTGVMLFLLSIFISYDGLFAAFYMDRPSVYAGLLFFGMLYAPIDFFLGLFVRMVSRRNEMTADRFAVQTTRNPQAFANALKKLSVNNLSNLFPHPLYVFLNDSHPPVLKRIADISAHER